MAAWPPHEMQDVVDYVEWQGDLAEVSMGELRDANGETSLKVHELGRVKHSVLEHGMKSLVPMKGNQNQRVWLYRRDTALGRFLEAAKDLTDEQIEALRNAPTRLPRIKKLRLLFDDSVE